MQNKLLMLKIDAKFWVEVFIKKIKNKENRKSKAHIKVKLIHSSHLQNLKYRHNGPVRDLLGK